MNIKFDEMLSDIGNVLQNKNVSIIRLTIQVFPTFTQRRVKRDLHVTTQHND